MRDRADSDLLMRAVRAIVTTFPFTLFGILSYVMLMLAADGTVPATGLWNLPIAPAYAVLLLISIAEHLLVPASLPAWISIVMLPFLLLPFVLIDLLFLRLRRWLKRMETVNA